MGFVNLHVHTEYSLLDGMCKIKELVSRAKEINQEALAITDHGNLHGMVKFYKECVKQGVKPIIGSEVYVVQDNKTKDPHNRETSHLVLLAKNNKGLENIIKIVSDASVNGFYYVPRTDHETLKEHSEGIICLSACQAGEIPKLLLNDEYDAAVDLANFYKEIFDEFYLEIQAGVTDEQNAMNVAVVDLAKSLGIPLVVTNDTHYINQSDAEDHEILLAIQTATNIYDEKRFKFDSNVYWLKSEEETRSMLLRAENISPDVIDQAIKNTVEISQKCEVFIELGSIHYPVFDVPEGETLFSHLKKEAEKGLFQYFLEEKATDMAKYKERLDYELQVIDDAGLSGYLLIVKDFVDHAREINVPTGPGRGSAAGSLAVFCLGITKVDPVKHGLSFERFFVPGRKGRPDIDMDFCRLRRKDVLEYVIKKYGKAYVAHIGTFGTFGAKSAIKDTARALGMPLEISEAISDSIPDSIVDEETDEAVKITIESSLAESESLREYEKKYPKLFEVAKKIEGLSRHTSSHAAGIVIAPVPLYGAVPLMRNKKENDPLPITQLDMDDVEELGWLKFDFLGLEALTTIQETLDMIDKQIDLESIPLDDEKVFKLICELQTLGVFQVCTNVGKAMAKQIQPKSFEELVDILAVGRPGPMKSGQDKEYVSRKFGWKEISYPHPKLESILSSTYGVMLYQEQIQAITRELAGFDHAMADKVRKAMGRKDMELVGELGIKFLDGCESLGSLDRDSAQGLWDQMARFGEYALGKCTVVY